MNERERSIFLRGIAVGMKAVEEFETDLIPAEKYIPFKDKRTTKLKDKMVRWTKDGDMLLSELYTGGVPMKEIKKHFPTRTIPSLNYRAATKLKLKRPKKSDEYDGLAKLNQKIDQ